MDATSSVMRLRPGGVPGPPSRLLAEAVVAVQCTLGCGDEDDDRALDRLERSVWLELALGCPDLRERAHLIEQAHERAAPAGVASCRHAARLLVATGGWLLLAAGGLADGARERVERCAALCGEGAVRLERIALEKSGV